MTTHAKIFLLFCTVAAVTFGQQAATKTNEQHALILPGKIATEWYFSDTAGTWNKDAKPETRVWLTVVSSNHRDWPKEGWNPAFTSVITKDYRPVVHKRADGAWEVTFESPIAEGIP